MRLRIALLSMVATTLACGDNSPTTVNPANLVMGIQAGDDQIVGPSSTVPLQVVIQDAASEEPAEGVTVSWRVTAGSGARVDPASSRTDSAGIATTQFTAGPQAGAYQVEASFEGMVGSPAQFTIRVVTAVSITSIAPTSARSGDTVTVTGEGFSTNPIDNQILFAGIRGTVVSATTTTLRAVVPSCLPDGSVPVQVMVGTVTSPSFTLAVTGGTGTVERLDPGQVVSLSDPAALSCLTLPGGQNGASYLVVVQNASSVAGQNFTFRLTGTPLAASTAGLPTTSAGAAAAGAAAAVQASRGSFATEWEARLRERERALVAGGAVVAHRGPRIESATQQTCSATPAVGDRCTFHVLNPQNTFTTVTATVQAVSTHAIVYQDTAAPAGGFTTTEYQRFAATFDDPIYDTDVSVFGAPSDLDQNGKIIILFTPVVNKQTPAGSSSFVAGFFYGCDLVSVEQCSGSNGGEIFYSLVPDSAGKFGLAQPKQNVLQTVPPVLAHEFMHMIHFNQRIILRHASSEESLWLSEALAHTAEDTVGGVYAQRADTANAITFKVPDFLLGFGYLGKTSSTTLVAQNGQGSVDERGAGWLFVKYLIGRFGGDVPGKLTQTTRSSTDNVSNTVGEQWPALFNDWAVSLWADDESDLAGTGLDPKYTYPNFDMRRVLGQPALGGVYPLQPTSFGFTTFTTGTSLVASSAAYYLITASGANPPSLNLRLTGAGGAPFPTGASPQLAILRVR